MNWKLLAFALFCFAAPARAEQLGNTDRGLDYARANCSGCHAVAFDDIASPNPDAPPFKYVADTPGMTATSLAVFFRTPHPTMPNFLIEGEDKDNIIAYILSLKGDGRHAPN